MIAATFNPTLRIREVLTGLCNAREHAFNGALQAGHKVEAHEEKMKAIEKIRLHLEAFKTCSESAHINLVRAFKEDIILLIPSGERFHKYRSKLYDMLNWCDQHSNQK